MAIVKISRLIPVLTGNSTASPVMTTAVSVNPRAYGEQAFKMMLR